MRRFVVCKSLDTAEFTAAGSSRCCGTVVGRSLDLVIQPLIQSACYTVQIIGHHSWFFIFQLLTNSLLEKPNGFNTFSIKTMTVFFAGSCQLINVAKCTKTTAQEKTTLIHSFIFYFRGQKYKRENWRVLRLISTLLARPLCWLEKDWSE